MFTYGCDLMEQLVCPSCGGKNIRVVEDRLNYVLFCDGCGNWDQIPKNPSSSNTGHYRDEHDDEVEY